MTPMTPVAYLKYPFGIIFFKKNIIFLKKLFPVAILKIGVIGVIGVITNSTILHATLLLLYI